jgi:hypothetical protein
VAGLIGTPPMGLNRCGEAMYPICPCYQQSMPQVKYRF